MKLFSASGRSHGARTDRQTVARALRRIAPVGIEQKPALELPTIIQCAEGERARQRTATRLVAAQVMIWRCSGYG